MRCPQPAMRRAVPTSRCSASQRSLTSTTPAAPSVIWQQSLRRRRPATTGFAASSAAVLSAVSFQERVWALRVVLGVAQVQLADGPQVRLVEAVAAVVLLRRSVRTSPARSDGRLRSRGRPMRRPVGLRRLGARHGSSPARRRAPGRSRSGRTRSRPWRPAWRWSPTRRRLRAASRACPTARPPPWRAWRRGGPGRCRAARTRCRRGCSRPGPGRPRRRERVLDDSATRSEISPPSRVMCGRSRSGTRR